MLICVDMGPLFFEGDCLRVVIAVNSKDESFSEARPVFYDIQSLLAFNHYYSNDQIEKYVLPIERQTK